ncbi:VOC family protein, partial [Singulisphaera rosea]
MAGSVASLELSFTEVRVSDWRRAVDWYARILGLKVVLEDAEREFALLAAGDARLALRG